MAGNLTFDELKKAVADGDDRHRRRRLRRHAGPADRQALPGASSSSRAAHEETHGCDYLLANDIDMEPVPGYAAASWDEGLRRLRHEARHGDAAPHAVAARARRWCSATCSTITTTTLAAQPARHPEAPDRAARRARDDAPIIASELEFYLFDETYESAAREALPRPRRPPARYIEDYHILQTTKEEGVMRAIRTGLQGAGIPVENSKGEWGPGQEEINVRYADALDDGRPARRSSRTASRRSPGRKGKAVTFMAKWGYGLAGSSAPHPRVAVGRGRQEAAVPRPEGRVRHVGADAPASSPGSSTMPRDITWFLAPYINSYKRFQVGTFAPTKAIWSRDNRTAGFRLVRRGHEGDPRRMPDRRRRPQPLPRLRRAARRRPRRHRARSSSWRRPSSATPITASASARCRRRCARRPRLLDKLEDAARRLRRRRRRPLRPHRRWEQFEYDRRITDWELKRGFERY